MISDGMASSDKPLADGKKAASADPQRAITRAVESACEQAATTPINVDIVKATPTAPALPPAGDDDELAAASVVSPLSERKQIAANALARRKSIKQAAKLAGVDQRTVRRWIRDDAQFKAALNTLTMEIAQILRLRTHALAAAAMDNVENAIDDGDMKASMYVLDKVEQVEKTSLPTTPEAVTEQMRLEACRLQLEIDRKREELWKLQWEIDSDRGNRNLKITLYGHKPPDPKISGTKPKDLPLAPQPEENPDADGS
jgi:hypothetical protein